MKQQTLAKSFSLEGVGLHTGKTVIIEFEPAEVNHGIRFMRVDMQDQPVLTADVNQVVSTNRGTTIRNGEAQISTVEHVLSALTGTGVDNVLIKVNGPEIPIMDGSAMDFVDGILGAGLLKQATDREYFEIEEPISFRDEVTGTELLALPGDKFEVTAMIDFNSQILGHQYASLQNIDDYATQIAPCRTFVFVRELEQLFDQNLIKGGDLDNAVVIADRLMDQDELDRLAKKLGKQSIKVEKTGILNTTSLKFENEPARHKLLDVLGDLTLLGKPIKGKIVARKPGHTANIEFTKLLKRKMMEQRKLKGRPRIDPDQPPLFDIESIRKLLPHRYPFLLVDKIVEMTDNYIVGVKNITFNEPFFQGHFPGNSIFPGVLQIEALAQVGGVFVLSKVEDPENWGTLLLKIDNTKFKYKVSPGDQLILKMELLSAVRRGICLMYGTAYVGSKLVSESELTAQIVRNQPPNE
ncbi:MAG: bifunctional UDP-3-O-[3-hydroxymyristoyl] N-acetylglucosamine deacetylase/3-hydroxyacyl-ACP dehydratase [Saprospiraceae bacterium]|nr:bifunctional UDP-3-O-[3-hydroxymyristoyl] N-acetylglucosamine deacetylase/3-hydroxyacyl-ACP dehydratase [Candidatus Opimibacter skivensis]MBL0006351.1 bifunctional UDP-3-O-[3-hydroxymyristoyl] N-acetylglucosamine deacetylase/3-hydroxyacyl-ACP dehydratase [Candidatus Opimibacter skivensis]MBP6681244.1 bifunctional UDP-3-O-[3-hydroxymyristoyl] N-acetylglucosamine deacetylase/3-hydroxyacyl-ACP dehydratase [Saprospiraceae bacterium]